MNEFSSCWECLFLGIQGNMISCRWKQRFCSLGWNSHPWSAEWCWNSSLPPSSQVISFLDHLVIMWDCILTFQNNSNNNNNMVLGRFDNFPRRKKNISCNLGLFLRSVKWVGLRVVTSVNRYSFLSCTHLEWLWMIFNFHPFFGHATDPKKLKVKGQNLS
jgi:hypothetical protein